MPNKNIVFYPVAPKQRCSACDNKAVISVDIQYDKGSLVTFFWLCQDHTKELASGIIEQGFNQS